MNKLSTKIRQKQSITPKQILQSRLLELSLDEIEKEPAYKRLGIDLDEVNHSSENNESRLTLNLDENEDIQLRTNNSFLHDNVD